MLKDNKKIAKYLELAGVVEPSSDVDASDSPFEQFEFDFMKCAESGDCTERTEVGNG